MFTVWTYDDATCCDVRVFEGTLDQCVTYVDVDTDEFYIVEPDGFTVYEG